MFECEIGLLFSRPWIETGKFLAKGRDNRLLFIMPLYWQLRIYPGRGPLSVEQLSKRKIAKVEKETIASLGL